MSTSNEITPLAKIQEAGSCDIREGRDGTKIIVLPSCTVKTEHLDPSGWDNPLHHGNFRSVLEIATIAGHRIDQVLLAKSPERRLTILRENLERGEIWWGGARGKDRYASKFFQSDKIVEDLGRWEAAFLTKLWQEKIPAEEPQAIIEYPNGCVNVVIKKIPTPWDGIEAYTLRQKSPVRPRDLCTLAIQAGLKPNDFQTCFDTHLSEDRIIDTARWTWPPYTDETHSRIMRLLLEHARDQ